MEREYYPLSSGQMVMYFTQKFCIKKQIVNICAEVSFLNEMDEALMAQALVLGVMRSKSFNCRLTMQDKKIVQYFVQDIPKSVDIEDMSNATPEQIQTQMEQWSAEPFPNKSMDVPLYRIRMIRMPGGLITLYLCVSHMIMDAYALMQVMDTIQKTYVALRDGNPVPDLRQTPLECGKVDRDYFTSDRHTKDQQWWGERFAKEPVFTSVNGKDSSEFVKGKNYGLTLRLWKVTADHLNLRIPAEVVREVEKYAIEQRAPLQCIYLLAIRSFLGRVSGTDDVTFFSSIARRSTVIQKHAGGTMVNAVPIRTVMSDSLTFREALEILYREQREVYRHADMPCGEILGIIKKIHNLPSGVKNYSYNSVSVTFQPYFTFGEGSFRYTVKRIKNGAAASPLYMSIMPIDDSGDLWANYEYLTDLVREDSLRHLHSFIISFIRTASENPDMVMSELIEKSM